MNPPQINIIKKDIKEMISSKQTMIPMIILPVIFDVILPFGLLFGAQFGMEGMNGMDQLIETFRDIFGTHSDAQLVSAKAKTFQDAQQMSGMIILPIIFFLIGQMTGLFMLNEIILFGAGAFLYALDYFLMRNATKRFVPEKLV